MVNNLMASVSGGSTHISQTVQSSLATMQADMAAALKNNQHIDIPTGSNDRQARSNELIATAVNEAGDKVLDDA